MRYKKEAPDLQDSPEPDIESRRRANHLSQAQLAEMIGVTQGQISKWEKGQAQPTDENRRKLIEALK